MKSKEQKQNKLLVVKFCYVLSHLRLFSVIFLLNNKNQENQFRRDKTYSFKTNKYSFDTERTCYGVGEDRVLPGLQSDLLIQSTPKMELVATDTANRRTLHKAQRKLGGQRIRSKAHNTHHQTGTSGKKKKYCTTPSLD